MSMRDFITRASKTSIARVVVVETNPPIVVEANPHFLVEETTDSDPLGDANSENEEREGTQPDPTEEQRCPPTRSRTVGMLRRG